MARLGDDPPPEAAAILDGLVATLQGIPGATVRRIDETVPWPSGIKDAEAARREAFAAAAALAATRGADVLLWCRVETIGHLLEVRAAAPATPHELRLGRVSPAARVFVPLEALVEPLPGLVRAMVLAAALAEGPRRAADLFAAALVAGAEGFPTTCGIGPPAPLRKRRSACRAPRVSIGRTPSSGGACWIASGPSAAPRRPRRKARRRRGRIRRPPGTPPPKPCVWRWRTCGARNAPGTGRCCTNAWG